MQRVHFRIKQDGQPIKQLANALQEHMGHYGYELIETPIIENADLFLTKAGDKVAEKLFTFERHGQILALRPEFTAAAAHLYTLQEAGQVARWQFSGAVFEDDPNMHSHEYQRYSVGAELIGMTNIIADAEIISMAVHGLLSQEVKDWTLFIGHVGLTQRLLARFELDPRTQHFLLSQRHLLRGGSKGKMNVLAHLARYIPNTVSGANDSQLELMVNATRSDTLGGRSHLDISQRIAKKRQQATQQSQINDALYFLQSWMNIESAPDQAMSAIAEFVGDDEESRRLFAEWQTLMALLEASQVPMDKVKIQPDLARTWDYYTGAVFEIRADDGAQLAGGGRYNELTRLIGGDTEIPAVGFAYYADRVLERLTPSQTSTLPTVYLLPDDYPATATRWAYELRKREVRVILVEDAEAVTRSVVFLWAVENDSIRLGKRDYTLDEIDLLVKTLHGR
ncbi:MAG: ATP phosphoribosyltransferase regulatory subunit [bacterium]|nr:ATP phosphoribosyltransferase regulatory subunit [bacterium]